MIGNKSRIAPVEGKTHKEIVTELRADFNAIASTTMHDGISRGHGPIVKTLQELYIEKHQEAQPEFVANFRRECTGPRKVCRAYHDHDTPRPSSSPLVVNAPAPSRPAPSRLPPRASRRVASRRVASLRVVDTYTHIYMIYMIYIYILHITYIIHHTII